MTTAVRFVGRLLAVASLVAWLVWLGWRVSSPMNGIVGFVVLLLEVGAFAAAAILSSALWRAPLTGATSAQRRASRRADVALPETMAVALALATAPDGRRSTVGADDTGEVAWARQGIGSLRPAALLGAHRPSLQQVAWSIVAVEGMRRMLAVVVVVAILFTGRSPFEVPPYEILALLVASQLALTLGHYLLSDGLIRPGARLRWSMASVGAGFGDGTSRTGLPIRWTSTLATMVVLNIVVSLRGLSDRWTHGLGAMAHDERVMAMAAAAWLVGWGFVALRALPQPELGYYGATRRLEETSTRRLALGATLTVAAIGLIAGVLARRCSGVTVGRSPCRGTLDEARDACRLVAVPTMRLFASAREAAGTGTDVFDGATVDEVLDRRRTALRAALRRRAEDLQDLGERRRRPSRHADRPIRRGGSPATRVRRKYVTIIETPDPARADAVGAPRASSAVAARGRRRVVCASRGPGPPRPREVGGEAVARRSPTPSRPTSCERCSPSSLTGGPARPPRPTEDLSDHPLAVELDEICADGGLGHLKSLDDAELAALTDAISGVRDADVVRPSCPFRTPRRAQCRAGSPLPRRRSRRRHAARRELTDAEKISRLGGMRSPVVRV